MKQLRSNQALYRDTMPFKRIFDIRCMLSSCQSLAVKTIANVSGTKVEHARVSSRALTIADGIRNDLNTMETCKTGLYLTASPSIV